ncbi:MAG TPA: hypothetical protein DCE65_04560 [Clostridiales bacterium]|nr:hypothetical protein [Clostridiales bacterium]
MKKVRKFLTALCIALSCSASLSALAACNGETQNNAITEYEITFLDKDGTPILNTKIKENDVPEFNGTLPALPENTAEYTYSWKWDKEFVAATGNASYKLILESTKRKYDVKFMDGETQIGATQNVEYGTIATKPADPQKAETAEKTYTFDGWYTAAEGGEKVTDFTVTGTAVYYAHYTSVTRKYDVKFMDGETQIGETQNAEYGTVATKPADPQKAETAEKTYAFDGWYTAAEGGEKVTDFTVTGAVTYYAHYTSVTRKYDVKFMDGETQIGATQNVEYGTIATKPADPQKAETAEKTYTFDGWYTAAEDGEKVTDFTVTGAVTYYAHYTYTIRSYTIRFLNGETVLKSVTLDYGTKLSVPEDISVEGYVIIGWNQDLPETVTGNADFVAVLAKELKQADAANFAAILAANPNDDYVLGSDIDFGGAELDGIGTFGGVFDGRGYALKNFKVKLNQYTATQWSYAFIANNAGTIKNVAITYTLKGNNGHEAVINENNGTIENVFVEVKMETTGWANAALVGINKGTGIIRNVIAVLTKDEGVSAGRLGAVVGADYNGTIHNAYGVCGDVIASSEDAFKTPYFEGWNNGSYVGNQNYTTMAELLEAKSAEFTEENGWNMTYFAKTFKSVLDSKNA